MTIVETVHSYYSSSSLISIKFYFSEKKIKNISFLALSFIAAFTDWFGFSYFDLILTWFSDLDKVAFVDRFNYLYINYLNNFGPTGYMKDSIIWKELFIPHWITHILFGLYIISLGPSRRDKYDQMFISYKSYEILELNGTLELNDQYDQGSIRSKILN